jgi:hypothetical protein
MIVGLISAMAGDTVGGAIRFMVEVRRQPGGGCVAGGALSIEVVDGSILVVAAQTVSGSYNLMIEGHIGPVVCVMAVGAIISIVSAGGSV